MIRALLDLYDLEVFFGAQSGRGGHGSDDSNSKRGCASEAGHLNQENPSSGGAQRRIKVDARAARYLDWALELQETQDQQFWDTSGGGRYVDPAKYGKDARELLLALVSDGTAEPAATSVALTNLTRLSVCLGPASEAIKGLGEIRYTWDHGNSRARGKDGSPASPLRGFQERAAQLVALFLPVAAEAPVTCATFIHAAWVHTMSVAASGEHHVGTCLSPPPMALSVGLLDPPRPSSLASAAATATATAAGSFAPRLWTLIKNDDVSAVRDLLVDQLEGALDMSTVNASGGYTLLTFVCSAGVECPDMVRTLLDAGCDRNRGGGSDMLTPLMISAKMGMAETVALLLRHQPHAVADGVADGKKRIRRAGANKGKETEEEDEGEDEKIEKNEKNEKNEEEQKRGGAAPLADVDALSVAATFKIMNQNVKTTGGQTALHMACKANDAIVANLLLDAGAASAVEDEDGLTPFAFEKGCRLDAATGRAVPFVKPAETEKELEFYAYVKERVQEGVGVKQIIHGARKGGWGTRGVLQMIARAKRDVE
jgi:ankyrin repeat protein